jgi:hypothetical protein
MTLPDRSARRSEQETTRAQGSPVELSEMFVARVKVFRSQHPSEDWGPRPAYHPEVDAGVYTVCTIERLGAETTFEFEWEYTVWLRLLFPEEYREAFAVGSPVHFYVGGRPVGRGTRLEIL